MEIPIMEVRLLNRVTEWFDRFLKRDKLKVHVSYRIIDNKDKVITSFDKNPRDGDTFTYQTNLEPPLRQVLLLTIDNKGGRSLKIERVIVVDHNGNRHSYPINKTIESKKQEEIEIPNQQEHNKNKKILVETSNGKTFKKIL